MEGSVLRNKQELPVQGLPWDFMLIMMGKGPST
jgi:hypothetical protein